MPKKILIAPLNWGLGHATRCIPIIKELLGQGYEPIIASDGAALELLKKEFPQLKSFSLPTYNISYANKGWLLKWKLMLKTPHIFQTISAEGKIVEKIVRKERISGIISDNRWGVRSQNVPSAFITHQVKVLSGRMTFFSSRIQQNYINKFDELWIPDEAEEPSLSGIMGHQFNVKVPVKYLGIVSRFQKQDLPKKFDITAILSGPEPQRSILENILRKELNDIPKNVALVQGLVEKDKKVYSEGNITIYNFLETQQLQDLINCSSLIICRPGYTSLMDLAILEKKLFVIPTPGQYEQEYLAKRLDNNKFARGCSQKAFTLSQLGRLEGYSGLRDFRSFDGLKGAFALFKGK